MVNDSTKYQQNEQKPVTLTHRTQKGWPRHMTLEIQVVAWDRHNNVEGLKCLEESQPSL